ncbi:unnamed protein product [Porites lobata]|uniref:G-protein coupled receptors family 1 profile domain-containing protein n=1 Tax=Porites lobata TaxID=104759 RepID=A0ABN8N0J4_9CNID|nr:unnamed protein product [Porites lobata]
METWFTILGWTLSIVAAAGNGSIIFLVCSKRRLLTKTNAFIISLAVADLGVGASVFPSEFFCEIVKTSHNSSSRCKNINWPIRWLFGYASVASLCCLVLDRYVAIVKPLKYLNFMSRGRVIKMIFVSWAIPVGFVITSFFLPGPVKWTFVHIFTILSLSGVDCILRAELSRAKLASRAPWNVLLPLTTTRLRWQSINPLRFIFYHPQFSCEIVKTSHISSSRCWNIDRIRRLFGYASVTSLCSLVLDRYVAIVTPLKYLNFMSRGRVIQMIFVSWAIPVGFVITSFFLLQRNFVIIFAMFWETFSCFFLIFCFSSMVSVVYKHDRSSATLAKQLRFNNRDLTVRSQDRSAVTMMAIVIVVFLVCYGIYLRCCLVSLLYHTRQCNDEVYKIPMLVLNSAINPWV